MNDVRRGELWWVTVIGQDSEPAGRRPALVLQTDAANKQPRYPNTIVVLLSTIGRENLPFHIKITPSIANGLNTISYVKCEQLLTISKHRLESLIGIITSEEMRLIEAGIRIVLNL